jgi:hypothetical protein
VTRNTGVSFGNVGFLVYLMALTMVVALVVAVLAVLVALVVGALTLVVVISGVDALVHWDRRRFATRLGHLFGGRRSVGRAEQGDRQARYSNRR